MMESPIALGDLLNFSNFGLVYYMDEVLMAHSNNNSQTYFYGSSHYTHEY